MPEFPPRGLIAGEPLSIILVSYDYSGEIEKPLTEWTAHLEGLGREYELFLVAADAASSSRLQELAKRGLPSRARLLPDPAQSGIGPALSAGLREARHPLVFCSECSSSYQPGDLQRLLEVIDQVDLVTGYRGWRARFTSLKATLFRWLVRLIFGVHFKDPDCFFKLFRRSLLARIPLQSRGSFVHSEILAKANFLGSLATEVPVSYERTATAQPSVSLWERWHDALHIFRSPDFGPAVLPEEPPPPPPAVSPMPPDPIPDTGVHEKEVIP